MMGLQVIIYGFLLSLGSASAVSASVMTPLMVVQATENTSWDNLIQDQKLKAAVSLYKAQYAPYDLQLEAGSKLSFFPKTQTYAEVGLQQLTPWLGSSFFANYAYGKSPLFFKELSEKIYSIGSLEVGFQLPLLQNRNLDIFRSEINIQNAKKALEKITLDFTKIKSALNALDIYWHILGDVTKIILHTTILQNAFHRVQALDKRFRSGDVPITDIMDNRRSIAQIKYALSYAQQNFQKSINKLKLHLGKSNFIDSLDQESLHVFFPSLLDWKLEKHLQLSMAGPWNLDQHPNVQGIEQEKTVHEQKYLYYKNQNLPKLHLKASYQIEIGESPENTSAITELLPFPYNSDPTQFVNIGLWFSMPLWMTKARNEKQVALAKVAIQEMKKNYTIQKLRLDIDTATMIMKNSQEQILQAEEYLTLSKELLEMEKRKAFLGDSNFFLVNLREQTILEAGIKRVDAIVQWLQAYNNYQLATGVIDLDFLKLWE